jgi:hypothetical protein
LFTDIIICGLFTDIIICGLFTDIIICKDQRENVQITDKINISH